MSDTLPTEAERKMMAEVGLTEQPLPVPNDSPSSHDIAIEEMRRRKEYGLRKYNSLLQAGNGRDSVQDAVDETADLFVYLLTERTERQTLAMHLEEVDHVLDAHGPWSPEHQDALVDLQTAVGKYLGRI